MQQDPETLNSLMCTDFQNILTAQMVLQGQNIFLYNNIS